jgi:hypothetical protein
MSTPLYRLTVVACALGWFLVGLHAPAVHQIMGHGRAPRVSLLVILALLVIAASASVWMLLRAPRQHPGSTPAAP